MLRLFLGEPSADSTRHRSGPDAQVIGEICASGHAFASVDGCPSPKCCLVLESRTYRPPLLGNFQLYLGDVQLEYPPQLPWTHAQNAGCLPKRQLLAHHPRNHFFRLHRPLPGARWICYHGRHPSSLWVYPNSRLQRTFHLLIPRTYHVLTTVANNALDNVLTFMPQSCYTNQSFSAGWRARRFVFQTRIFKARHRNLGQRCPSCLD